MADRFVVVAAKLFIKTYSNYAVIVVYIVVAMGYLYWYIMA